MEYIHTLEIIGEALEAQSIEDMLSDLQPETFRDDLTYLAEHGLL